MSFVNNSVSHTFNSHLWNSFTSVFNRLAFIGNSFFRPNIDPGGRQIPPLFRGITGIAPLKVIEIAEDHFPMMQPSSPIVKKWLRDSLDYGLFKREALRGGFAHLSQSDLRLILEFAAKNEIVHKTIIDKNYRLLDILMGAGVDLNALDSAGRSPLTYVTDPDIFIKLVKNGATLRGLEWNKISYFIFDNGWNKIFPQILPYIPREEFAFLNVNKLLLAMHQDRCLQIILENIAKEIYEEDPQLALKIVRHIFGSLNWDDKFCSKTFISLIEANALSNSFIESLLTSPEVLKFCSKTPDFFYQIAKIPIEFSPEVNDLLQQTKNLEMSLILASLLSSKTVLEARDFLNLLIDYKSQIPSPIRIKIVQHLEALQDKDNISLWSKFYDKGFLYRLGLNANWLNRKKQNYLFTEMTDFSSNYIGFNLVQIDNEGNNPLDYQCKNIDLILELKNIRGLIRFGATLSSSFPNIEKCRQTFPNNKFLQCILGACLYNPRKSHIKTIICHLDPYERPIFLKAIEDDPELKAIIGKKLEKRHLSPNTNIPEQFKKYFQGREELYTICSLWADEVPLTAFTTIPQYPIVSLIINAIRREDFLGFKIPIHQLFSNTLTNEERTLLNRTLFEQPELMNKVMRTYMRLKTVDFKYGGNSISNYAKCVIHLMGPLAKQKIGESSLTQHFSNAIQTTIVPTPLESFSIPEGAKIKVLGRTAIIEGEEECQAYKFFKKGETYSHYAQEIPVTQTFNDHAGIFQSPFIKPLGVYAVKQLPQELLDRGFENNSVVFKYRADPKTFVYLQDVSEDQFPRSRLLCIQDAVEMIRLDIYPDLAALFHNQEQSRQYSLLIDLFIFEGVSPGGSGRLEKPFSKIRYPNMRQSGLTDLRDATLKSFDFLKGYYNEQRIDFPLMYRLQALSNLMLVDMLLLVERSSKESPLDWQNEALMSSLGEELAQGFASILSSYAKIPHAESFHFALKCGIDWTRAARQISFWSNTSPNGYPSWLKQGRIPSTLYEKGVVTSVDPFTSPNFDLETGIMSTDGEHDFGLYNGPSGIEEFTKAAYLLYLAIIL